MSNYFLPFFRAFSAAFFSSRLTSFGNSDRSNSLSVIS